MSVHVKHLNADSTSLLTFATTPSPSTSPSDSAFNGTFTVLTDPWLAESGAPQYHRKFAFASRKIPAHISHLSQLDPPDVVIISQVNTDHCHEETLRQLPADLPHTTILAHPDAAKKIRSWKYFRASKIHALPTYSDKNHNTVLRFSIPSKHPGSTPGEATVTLIRQPRDMTKLHSAIAITYRPPTAGASLTKSSGHHPSLHAMRSQPNLQDRQPAEGHHLRSILSQPSLKQHQKSFQPAFPAPPLTPPDTPPESEHDPQERPRTATPPKRNFHLRNPSDTPSYRQRSRGNSDATTKTLSILTRASSISEAPRMESDAPSQTLMLRPKTSDGHTLPPLSPPPTAPLPPIPDTAPLSPNAIRYMSTNVSAVCSPNIGSVSGVPSTVASPNIGPLASPQIGFNDGIMSTLASPTLGICSDLPSPRLGFAADDVCRTPTTAHATTALLGSAKTLSVLYAPHGISYASVKPYATTHLVHTAALPLTVVMHPFERIDNPWWFGGNISAGVPGGVEIVRKLMGRHWIKTHDEEKEESGFGLKLLKKGRWTVQEVQELLENGTKRSKSKKMACSITELSCGEEMMVEV